MRERGRGRERVQERYEIEREGEREREQERESERATEGDREREREGESERERERASGTLVTSLDTDASRDVTTIPCENRTCSDIPRSNSHRFGNSLRTLAYLVIYDSG